MGKDTDSAQKSTTHIQAFCARLFEEQFRHVSNPSMLFTKWKWIVDFTEICSADNLNAIYPILNAIDIYDRLCSIWALTATTQWVPILKLSILMGA